MVYLYQQWHYDTGDTRSSISLPEESPQCYLTLACWFSGLSFGSLVSIGHSRLERLFFQASYGDPQL
jgi:hypothetical protein